MAARAVVIKTHSDGDVDLEFDAGSRCAGCSGTCMWRRMDARQVIRVHAMPTLEVGSAVLVSLPERYVLIGSLLVHGLPLLALLAGAAIGAFLIRSDLGVVFGAVLGMACIYAATPWVRRAVERATLAELRVESQS